MDITKIREQTAAARAFKEELEKVEFLYSPLKELFDRRIQKAASKGKGELSLNFFDIKERVLGERYGGPTIDTVIRHYSNEGFDVRKENLLSPNGSGNMSLIISWM